MRQRSKSSCPFRPQALQWLYVSSHKSSSR
jgi:hypothetical protein